MSITLKELKQRKQAREAAVAASQLQNLKLIRVTLQEGFKQRHVMSFEKFGSENIKYALSKELNEGDGDNWYEVDIFHPDDEDEEMEYMWITCISQDTSDKTRRNFPPDFVERFMYKTLLLYPEQPGNLFYKDQISCLLEAA